MYPLPLTLCVTLLIIHGCASITDLKPLTLTGVSGYRSARPIASVSDNSATPRCSLSHFAFAARIAAAFDAYTVVSVNMLSSVPARYSPSLASGVLVAVVFFFLAAGCSSARRCFSFGFRYTLTFLGLGSLVCSQLAETPVYAPRSVMLKLCRSPSCRVIVLCGFLESALCKKRTLVTAQHQL